MKVVIYEHYDFGIHGNQRYLMLLLDRVGQLYSGELDLTLVVPSDGEFYNAARAAGRVVVLNRKNIAARCFSLFRKLRELRPDLVLCNNEASFLTVLPAALLLRKKMIWHVKNLRRKDWSDALCFFFARRVLTISRHSIEIKHQYLVKRFDKKVFVQPIGTGLEEFLKVPEVTVADSPFRVLALLFISRDKGADTLVEALEKLDFRGVAVHVRIAGITPVGCECLESELKRRTRRLQNVKVEWLGWRDDVLFLLQWCQSLVHPSRNDGSSRSVVEAMACARPVVASRVGGIAELLTDGKDGFLIPAASAEALAERVARLAGDGDLMNRIGVAARQRAVREFDIDRHIERLKRHIKAVTVDA